MEHVRDLCLGVGTIHNRELGSNRNYHSSNPDSSGDPMLDAGNNDLSLGRLLVRES